MRTRFHRWPWSIFTSILLSATLLGITCAAANVKDTENKAPDQAAAREHKKVKPVKGRLPAYFRTVVTDGQRQKIYVIESEYAPRIRELKEQLKAITDERNAKINAVLTPEQRNKIAQLKEAAKEKRRKAKEKAAAPGA